MGGRNKNCVIKLRGAGIPLSLWSRSCSGFCFRLGLCSFVWFLFGLVFLRQVSPCNPGWPGTHKDSPASVSKVLGWWPARCSFLTNSFKLCKEIETQSPRRKVLCWWERSLKDPRSHTELIKELSVRTRNTFWRGKGNWSNDASWRGWLKKREKEIYKCWHWNYN